MTQSLFKNILSFLVVNENNNKDTVTRIMGVIQKRMKDLTHTTTEYILYPNATSPKNFVYEEYIRDFFYETHPLNNQLDLTRKNRFVPIKVSNI